MAPFYLKWTFQEEQNFNLRDISWEKCWLTGVVNLLSRYWYELLCFQQPRWEKAAWYISTDGEKFVSIKWFWSVNNVFHDFIKLPDNDTIQQQFKELLPWDISIGHNRYATSWSADSPENIQPLSGNFKGEMFFIAHNGTLADADTLRIPLTEAWVVFASNSDTEIFAQYIQRSEADTLEDAIIDAANRIDKAFSLLVMTKNKLYTLKDRYGVRPLHVWELTKKDGQKWYLLASEDYVFDQYTQCDKTKNYEVWPGQMIIFERGKEGYVMKQYAQPDEHFCSLEKIYFQNPRSKHHGFYNEDYRQLLAKQILLENPWLVWDAITAVLDSGKQAAFGLSKHSGIPYKEYFMRLHNSPTTTWRSFTASQQHEREVIAYNKLNLREDKVQGKHIILVDDSIVRWTTLKINIDRLRNAWAKKITIVISSPPIENICNLWMDYADPNQLIAYVKQWDIEEIRKEIWADTLIYLSLEGLLHVEQQIIDEALKTWKTCGYQSGTCTWCFGGTYPWKK